MYKANYGIHYYHRILFVDSICSRSITHGGPIRLFTMADLPRFVHWFGFFVQVFNGFAKVAHEGIEDGTDDDETGRQAV